MKTVKTILQSACEYSINQLGTCTFRIAYRTDGSRRTNHVEAVFDSVESAEVYIASISKSDAAIKQVIDVENVLQIRQLISAANMTQKAFAEYFLIPLRTVENWCSGARSCPGYVVDLIKYKLKNEHKI